MTVAPGWVSGLLQVHTLVPRGIALPCIMIPVMYAVNMMSRALSQGTTVT